MNVMRKVLIGALHSLLSLVCGICPDFRNYFANYKEMRQPHSTYFLYEPQCNRSCNISNAGYHYIAVNKGEIDVEYSSGI
jgi:hypothetical protein